MNYILSKVEIKLRGLPLLPTRFTKYFDQEGMSCTSTNRKRRKKGSLSLVLPQGLQAELLQDSTASPQHHRVSVQVPVK